MIYSKVFLIMKTTALIRSSLINAKLQKVFEI